MTRFPRRAIAICFIAAALALTAACGPTGYVIRFAALGTDSETPYIVRDIDCTAIAYAGGRPILITDTRGGEGVDKLTFRVRTNPSTAPRIRILDQAGADTVEFICTMSGREGDSLDCEVTFAGSGKIAPLLGAREFDVIETPTGLAICSGTINLRA